MFHAVNALLMTAKRERLKEIGEEELPELFCLPFYKQIVFSFGI